VKKILIAALAALLPAWTAPVQAGALADLVVLNRTTGERIRAYVHRGRLYVPGTPGEKYSLLVTNKSSARLLSVVAVDGVNVITGETAAPAQSGYVLDSGASVDIAGWRKNMSEVAAFVFTPLPDSYAARTDRPDNVGVIGVAVFREYLPPPPRPPDLLQQHAPLSDAGTPGDAARESASGAAPDSASARMESFQVLPKAEEKLGTGHGEREASAARWTDFRRASERPNELISIYYDSSANLIARGIIPGAPRAEPNPFPGFRFAPDPRS